eukprot:Gregarina_sp_Poly_1__3197@NODE_190_length_11648_cov_127_353855_g169_i0_p7_GENE_NODE_190_length_11648_cov_127_353855_g169_i0NODE_190_length_11648_cov_127_353855_g169_i0_p7_ORF_typecomplete_len196_score24_05_NODE_190_length_11648_cov_127_353855_g169_i021162703
MSQSCSRTENLNPQCVSILSSFAMVELRTERFLMGGEDQLPFRVLDNIRRLKKQLPCTSEPAAVFDQSLSRNVLLEFFLAWISELCHGGENGVLSYSRAALLRRLLIEVQDDESSILPLKGFEVNNFHEFLLKRLGHLNKQDTGDRPSNCILACLHFICFGNVGVSNLAIEGDANVSLLLLSDPFQTIASSLRSV